jgi:hypothetical protein
MSELVVPDAFGEVSGWRAWNIVGTLRFPRLQSVNAHTHAVDAVDSIWPTDRWFYARCAKRGHKQGEIPVEACSCGLYAARDREHLLKLHYGAYGSKQLKAVGEVAFAGKVIQGSQGWRAEKGRIKNLILPSEYWQFVEPLAEAYNVPVELGFLFSEQDKQRVLRSDGAEARAAEAKARRLAELRAEHDGKAFKHGDW